MTKFLMWIAFMRRLRMAEYELATMKARYKAEHDRLSSLEEKLSSSLQKRNLSIEEQIQDPESRQYPQVVLDRRRHEKKFSKIEAEEQRIDKLKGDYLLERLHKNGLLPPSEPECWSADRNGNKFLNELGRNVAERELRDAREFFPPALMIAWIGLAALIVTIVTAILGKE